jgi:hypothetical protein
MKREPLGPRPVLKNASCGDPTPERTEKALEIGRKIVDRRVVRKFMTTLDHLERHEHLSRDLRVPFDKYCKALVVSQHVNPYDEGPSTSHLVSSYDGVTSDQIFASRNIPQHVLDAQAFCAAVQREIPEGMWDIVNQLVGEETGHLQGRPPSLQKHGRGFGWKQDKQAAAAGAMHVIDACMVIKHAVIKHARRQKNSQ